MLSAGEELFKRSNPNINAQFVHDDAVYMNQIPDGSCNIVVTSYGADYTPQNEIPRFYETVKRVLVPGGRFIVLIPSFGRCEEYLRAGQDYLGLPPEPLQEGEFLETTVGLNGQVVQKTYWKPESWLETAVTKGFDIRALSYPIRNRTIDVMDLTRFEDISPALRVVAYSLEKPGENGEEALPWMYQMLFNDLVRSNSDPERSVAFDNFNRLSRKNSRKHATH